MECWFQRYDDRRAGRVAGIRVDRPAKNRGREGRETRESRRAGKGENKTA